MSEHVTSGTVRDRSGVETLRVRRSSRKDGASPEKKKKKGGKKSRHGRIRLPDLRGQGWRVSLSRKSAAVCFFFLPKTHATMSYSALILQLNAQADRGDAHAPSVLLLHRTPPPLHPHFRRHNRKSLALRGCLCLCAHPPFFRLCSRA